METPVKVGDEVSFGFAGDPGELVKVKEACANKNNGNWFCVTHQKLFRNNFEMERHLSKGKHVTAWNCFEHGLEKA